VAIQARAADYSFGTETPNLAGGRAGSAQGAIAARAPGRTPESTGAGEFLALLARAVQQFHTYPPTSPLCLSAVDACRRALGLDLGDRLTFRVTPHELLVNDVPIGRGTLIEHELARRLHHASIAQVTFEHGASPRELTRFCLDLLHCSHRRAGSANLIDRLAEHGVDRVSLRPAYRPEVLQVAPPSAPVASIVEHQRERRAAAFTPGVPVDHLYPPDKGWIRVDPSASFDTISLIDLAVLIDDPAALATMLLRLTDDVPEGEAGGDALVQKFSDVATLFAALDPNVARVMFSKLARAVLELDTDHRQILLRRTILPGLLDGRIDGAVLKDFPDMDLAESLCLLLDLETAAPEVVSTALARLDLPAERQAALAPLIEERLQVRTGTRAPQAGLDAHARRLIKVDKGRSASFAEFSAFDLALDEETVATLDGIRDGVSASEALADQLDCLWHLIRLEPNPEVVQRFAARTLPLLDQLERARRWPEFAAWLTRYHEMAEGFREPRPDVADVIAGMLAQLCTPDRARTLVEVAESGDEGKAAALAMIAALGSGVGPALLSLLEARADARDTRSRTAVQLLCDQAKLVAPALVVAVGSGSEAADRAVARVFGFAGPGFEGPLATLLTSRDEQTVREALRSLARIGTPQAASVVSHEIERHTGWLAGAAEETLWHFPKTEAARQVRDLLGRRDFAVRRPAVATRLLDRTTVTGGQGIEPILAGLAPLRYRFWRPSLARLGRKAHALLQQ
jgi:hypothetical protein